jgi:hypothetical protein
MSFKKYISKFLKLIFESFMHVIKFKKTFGFIFISKSQISGFGGLGASSKVLLSYRKP